MFVLLTYLYVPPTGFSHNHSLSTSSHSVQFSFFKCRIDKTQFARTSSAAFFAAAHDGSYNADENGDTEHQRRRDDKG